MLPFGRFRRRGKVAVIEIFGTIGGAVRSAPYEQVLERARSSRSIGAVVLDIDSPGGSVPASEYLYRSAAKVAGRKPVVAVIRGVGASGAYMLACAAHRVVATPGALVGSIGVISVRPVLAEALGRLGVDVSVTKRGDLKDMGALWRAATPEEEGRMQDLIDGSYARFMAIVAESRGLSEDATRELATGEVFWAERALEAGLVDELGDLETAVERAAQMAGCRKAVVRMGPRKSLGQRLLRPLSESLVESVAGELERRLWVQALR